MSKPLLLLIWNCTLRDIPILFFRNMAIIFCTLSKIGIEFPGRILSRLPRSIFCHFLVLATCILCLNGCAITGDLLAKLPLNLPIQGQDSIEKNYFQVHHRDDVIGRLAAIRLKRGNTLPDVARHFSLGINTVRAANPGVDVWVPSTGKRVLLPLSFILPEAPRRGIVINLAAMRLFYYKKDGKMHAVSTFPVGVGTSERPTPMGRMYVTRKKLRPTWYVPASIAADHRKKGDPLPASVPPGPLNPLGDYALYLSKSGYLVHGTNKPSSIGLRATNGCIRLYPEDIKQLFKYTPVKTPVRIVNQPYLVGVHHGMVYLEVHKPFKEVGADKLRKAYVKMRRLAKQTGHSLNWRKVKSVLTEARGIPVAVSIIGSRGRTAGAEVVSLRHPGSLNGQPEVPEIRTDAWYVLAATLRDKVDARRLAAIINHQGPPIPARVLSIQRRHRVLAGPFDNKGEARKAAKRMKIDLEIDGILVPPGRQG